MENKCLNCARFPFCEEEAEDKKDCANFIKRSYENEICCRRETSRKRQTKIG